MLDPVLAETLLGGSAPQILHPKPCTSSWAGHGCGGLCPTCPSVSPGHWEVLGGWAALAPSQPPQPGLLSQALSVFLFVDLFSLFPAPSSLG